MGWATGIAVVLLGIAVALGVVGRVLGRRQRRRTVDLPRVRRPIPVDDQAEVRRLHESGHDVRALLLLRRRHRLDLGEGRQVMAELTDGEAYPTSWQEASAPVPGDLRQEVRETAAAGRKVEAIRLLRQRVRITLTDAVALVDVLAAPDPSASGE